MALSTDLISQFAKVTKDETKTKKETTVYGIVNKIGGKLYVKFDGSDLLTPVSTTADAKDGQRVAVTIKNHTATINGNLSSPSAQVGDVRDLESSTAYKTTDEQIRDVQTMINNLKDRIDGFKDYVETNELNAVNADIESLEARFVDVNMLTADDIRATNATIERIKGTVASFKDLDVDELDAAIGIIGDLKAYTADFTYVFADELEAIHADIGNLDATKVSADELYAENGEIKFANIDFANIGRAAFEYIFSHSGVIGGIEFDGDKITAGKLEVVRINGSLIDATTIKADSLILKDSESGLYHEINLQAGKFEAGEAIPTDSIHGSVITADSVTAEKIHVTDLSAFGATIGGFEIKNNAIHSAAKDSMRNGTKGLLLGRNGQTYIGGGDEYIKFYRELKCSKTDTELDPLPGQLVIDVCIYDDGVEAFDVYEYIHPQADEKTYYTIDNDKYYQVDVVEGEFKLDISAKAVRFQNGTLAEAISLGTIKVYNPETKEYDEIPCIELAESDSDFKHVVTNKSSQIMDGSNIVTEMTKDGIETEDVTVRGEIKHGGWAWVTHGQGNLGLMWKGADD